MADQNLRLQQAKRTAKKNQGEKVKVTNLIKKTKDDYEEPPKGNPKGKCKTCQSIFDQDYCGETNKYSSYHTCLECRHKVRWKKEEKAKQNGEEINGLNGVLNYTPYPYQQKAHDTFKNHRFQLLAIGNRAGKDRYTIMQGIMYFVECLNENRHIDNPELVPSVYWWQIAPTEKLALQNWRELKKFFPKQWVVAVSDSTMTMQTIGGGIIEVRSAYDPESLVGVGLDLVTITEGARIKDLDIVWANLEARLNSEGRGLAKDRKGAKYGMGKAIINSSPLSGSTFNRMYYWGDKNHSEYSSNWVSHNEPWTANPAMAELAATIVKTRYGEITYAKDLERRIGERTYRQNYLAELLQGINKPFTGFEKKTL